MNTLRQLLFFLRPFLRWVLLSVFLGVLTILSAVGLMGTSAYVISGAALAPSIAELQVAIVGVRFFGISRGVFRYLERLASHSVNFLLLERLRVWFYRSVEPLAPAGLQDRHSGDLLARSIGDIETLENFYVRAVAPPMVAVVVTLGLSVFIGRLNGGFAAVLGLGLFISGVGVPWLARQMGRKPGKEVVATRASLNVAVVDSVQGMADLLAFGAEERQMARLKGFGSMIGQAQRRLAVATGVTSAGNLLVTNLTLLGILVMAVPYLRSGGMDGVTLAVLTLLILSGFEAVLPLGAAAQQLESCLAAGERVFELANTPPPVDISVQNGISLNRVTLEVHGLGFRYAEDAAWALHDFNLDLPAGKQVALVGASGSGKTTLFNLLLRFWEFSEGEILLDGRDIRAYAPEEVRRNLGWLPQTPFLFAGSLRDNLSLANSEGPEEAMWRALNLVGLAEWARALPLGLDSWVGERGIQLSGGERQRISIARVILHDARLLLLDEPTANLDRENESLVLNALQNLSEGRSAIWVTHKVVGLECMDEIIVLRDGVIAERGKFDKLVEQQGIFAGMLAEQKLSVC